MRGKYSPTVTAAYMANQSWHGAYAKGEIYDPEGYDSYGYNEDDYDRAGNHENDYARDDEPGGLNSKFESALEQWGFDGTKPLDLSLAPAWEKMCRTTLDQRPSPLDALKVPLIKFILQTGAMTFSVDREGQQLSIMLHANHDVTIVNPEKELTPIVTNLESLNIGILADMADVVSRFLEFSTNYEDLTVSPGL